MINVKIPGRDAMPARDAVQSVHFSVLTKPTQAPSGTVPDHWHWVVSLDDAIVAQVQTVDPEATVDLATGAEYAVSVVLQTAEGFGIGDIVAETFYLDAPPVIIEAAASIVVDM